MKHIKIGIIDSGKGGLTVANTLAGRPGFELYYYADTANLPYGNKSNSELQSILYNTLQIISQYNVDYIILACHTLSTVVNITQYNAIPIITMLSTVVPQACANTKTQTIGILATQASINSSAHKQAIHAINSNLNVIEQACPKLASALEIYPSNDEYVIRLIKQYLQPLLSSNIDTLILGCTHYALAHKEISEHIGKHVHLISSEKYIVDVLSNLKITPQSLKPSRIIYV